MIDYPRAGRRGVLRFLPSWRQVLGLVVLGVAAVAAAFVVAYSMVDVPEPDDQALAQSTVVYYADGTTEVGRYGEANRRNVRLDQVPQHVRDAVLAAEDRSFYSNSGISPTGIARALWSNLRNENLQGGSTITQQYVKNVYLTPERTLTRKLQEWVIAIKVDREASKDEILEDYLNTIYFGRGAYGVQTASEAYFGVGVDQLDTAQAAFLAGIIPAPVRYDPAEDPEAAQRRWRYVVDGMVTTGALTAAEAQQLVFPEVRERSTRNRLGGTRGYILDVVRQELTRQGFDAEDIEVGGLSVVTTIDRRLMTAAAEAVHANRVDEVPEDIDLHVALASVEPGTGALKAFYGGQDFVERPFNDAVQGATQPGSTFKPFALAAALEQGIALDTRFDGSDERSFDEYNEGRPVGNFGGSSYGWIDLVEATENSVNTVYVDLALEVGPDSVLDAVLRSGIPEDTQDLGPNPSLVLGTPNVRPVDLAEAYATFAAQGEHADWYVVQEVRGPNDGILYQVRPDPQQVFEADVMADLTYALQQVVEDGSGAEAQALGRPSAGKTGTTDNNRSAWYAGYVPQLSTVVGMWDDSDPPSLRGYGGNERVTGGSYPARIWTAFMRAALEGVPVESFPERADVGEDQRESREQAPDPEPEPVEEEPSEEPQPTPSTPTEEQPSEPAEPTVQEPTGPTEQPSPTETGQQPSEPAGPTQPGGGPTEPVSDGEPTEEAPGGVTTEPAAVG